MDTASDGSALPTSRDLRRTLHEQRPLLDGPALSDVVGVRVRRGLDTTEDLLDAADGNACADRLREAAARSIAWLAENVGAYLRLPSQFAHSHAVDGGHAPLLQLVDRLDLLALTLDRVYDAALRGDTSTLDAQLGLLRDTFWTHTVPAALVGESDITPDQLDDAAVERNGLEVGDDGIPRLPVPEQPDPVHEHQEIS
jgi:hypothetical protein